MKHRGWMQVERKCPLCGGILYKRVNRKGIKRWCSSPYSYGKLVCKNCNSFHERDKTNEDEKEYREATGFF